MATFVLVHGSWHGGWCWRFVSRSLRSKGHEVYTPTLTGLGANSHMIECGVNLNTHIQDVANLLFYEDLSKVILVGHSYGGMVITGVAGKSAERLANLVYLDAMIPLSGQREFDLLPPEEREGKPMDMLTGTRLRPPPPLSYLGINDTELGKWVSERLTNQPLAAYDTPVPSGVPNQIPHIYIHCTGGPSTRIFAHFAAKARAEGWQVLELATGHDAMLTMPRELTDILLELAT